MKENYSSKLVISMCGNGMSKIILNQSLNHLTYYTFVNGVRQCLKHYYSKILRDGLKIIRQVNVLLKNLQF